MRHVKTAAALAIGLIIGASAVAIGNTPPQTFTGCLSKDGTIQRVAVGDAPAQACNKNETQIWWNSEGPPGPQGEPGTGGGVAGLDDLRGTACNIGTQGEGQLEVTYGADGVATLRCATTAMVSVTIRFAGTGTGQVTVGDGQTPPRVCKTSDVECTWQFPHGLSSWWGYDEYAGSHFVGFVDGVPLQGTDGTMWGSVVLTGDLTAVAEFATN